MDTLAYAYSAPTNSMPAPTAAYGDVSGRHIVTFFLISLILSALSGVRDFSGPPYVAARAVLVLLLLLSILMPARLGIPLYLMLVIVGPDMAQISSERLQYGEYNIASIWRLYIGPVRPSWIIAGCMIIQLLRTLPFALDRRVKRAMIWFATVPAVTGFAYGGYATEMWSFFVVADVRFGVLIILSILLFHGFLRKHPQSLRIILAIFVAAILGRCLCDLVYWFLGYGPLLAGTSRASVDSAKSTVIFILLFAVYLTMRRRHFVVGPLLAVMSGMLIIIYATRTIWLTTGLCVFVLLYLLGTVRALLTLPVVLILGVLTFQALEYVREDPLEAVARRAETMAIQGGGNYLQRLDYVRYGEIVNSLNTSLKRFAIVLGNGYGSYYSDEIVRFPPRLVDAHSKYAARTGRFFSCHNYLFHILFKHGIIGLVIITALWVTPAWDCYRRAYDRTSRSILTGLLVCFIAFTPNALISLYWSGKSVLISGFIIAVLIAVAERYRGDVGVSTRAAAVQGTPQL